MTLQEGLEGAGGNSREAKVIDIDRPRIIHECTDSNNPRILMIFPESNGRLTVHQYIESQFDEVHGGWVGHSVVIDEIMPGGELSVTVLSETGDLEHLIVRRLVN